MNYSSPFSLTFFAYVMTRIVSEEVKLLTIKRHLEGNTVTESSELSGS